MAALLQALFASALTGGGFTGAALNPARVLGELLLTAVTNSYARCLGKMCAQLIQQTPNAHYSHECRRQMPSIAGFSTAALLFVYEAACCLFIYSGGCAFLGRSSLIMPCDVMVLCGIAYSLLCFAGPAMVFGCGWKAAPVYILAELLGGVAGSVISWPLYGTGLQFGR
jgi:hypothetical protein